MRVKRFKFHDAGLPVQEREVTIQKPKMKEQECGELQRHYSTTPVFHHSMRFQPTKSPWERIPNLCVHYEIYPINNTGVIMFP